MIGLQQSPVVMTNGALQIQTNQTTETCETPPHMYQFTEKH